MKYQLIEVRNVKDFTFDEKEFDFEDFLPKLLSHPTPGKKELFIDFLKSSFLKNYREPFVEDIVVPEDILDLPTWIDYLSQKLKSSMQSDTMRVILSSSKLGDAKEKLLLIRNISNLPSNVFSDIFKAAKYFCDHPSSLQERKIRFFIEGSNILDEYRHYDQSTSSIYSIQEFIIPEYEAKYGIIYMLQSKGVESYYRDNDIEFLWKKTLGDKVFVNKLVSLHLSYKDKAPSVQVSEIYRQFIYNHGDDIVVKSIFEGFSNLILETNEFLTYKNELKPLLLKFDELKDILPYTTTKLLVDYGIVRYDVVSREMILRGEIMADLVDAGNSRLKTVQILFDKYFPTRLESEEWNNNLIKIKSDILTKTFNGTITAFNIGYAIYKKNNLIIEGESVEYGLFEIEMEYKPNLEENSEYYWLSYSFIENEHKIPSITNLIPV